MQFHKKNWLTLFFCLLVAVILGSWSLLVIDSSVNRYVILSIGLLLIIAAFSFSYFLRRMRWSELKRRKAEQEVHILNRGTNLPKEQAELLRLMEEVAKNESKYNLLIENAVYAIYISDLRGDFHQVNTSFCALTNYSRQELLQRNIRSITAEPLRALELLPQLAIGQSIMVKTRFLDKDGVAFDVELDMSWFGDQELFAVVRDISTQKKLETELRDMELKFQTLAEKAVIGVYLIQQESFIYVNQKFAAVFGYEPDELILKINLVETLITHDCQELVRENIQARHRGELDFVNYEVTGKQKNGAIIHVEFSGSRVVIDGVSTIIGTMIEVTERWEKERALKHYQANLQTIMEITDTAYGLFDKELNVTGFNQMAVNFIVDQYHHQPAQGDQLADYFPKDRFPRFLEYADKVLKGGNISYEISYPQMDGSLTWYYVRLFPITNNENEIFGLILALSNITERKNAEDNLKAAYTRIHNHIGRIQSMAWKQSHLVRSPLANLKGLVSLLKDDPTDDEIMSKIKTELQRLDDIIIELANDASSGNEH